MKNIKKIIFVLFALTLTSSVFVMSSCSNEDNPEIKAIYEQTENFTSNAETRTVTLPISSENIEIGTCDAQWVTVTALANDGNGNSQVEVKVEENTEAPRMALQVIKVGRYTVLLFINQGYTNIDDPNEEVSDQPAYAPGR